MTIEVFEMIWVNVNLELGDAEGNDVNDDNDLVRKELLEFIIRSIFLRLGNKGGLEET